MDPDSFDDVLLRYGEIQAQAQEPPRERTQEEIEEEERLRERQRQMQEDLDEVNALREWEERIEHVESLRAEFRAVWLRGPEEMDRAQQSSPPPSPSPSPTYSDPNYWDPEWDRDELEVLMEEVWPTRTPPTDLESDTADTPPQTPLDMDTAETEIDDDADVSELALERASPSRSSPPLSGSGSTDSPAESSSSEESDGGGEEPSDDEPGDDDEPSEDGAPPPAPILGPTGGLTDDISEVELSEDEAEPPRPPVPPPAQEMFFEMEMDGEWVDEGPEDDGPKNDSDIDIDMSMSRGRVLGPYDTPPRQPIAIRVRNRPAHDMAELDMEVFLDEVRGFSIGFQPNLFPWLVMQQVRGMRQTALPGSFEHLLMHMFDDLRHVAVYQADVRQTGIQRYIKARRDGASHDDAVESSRADSSLPGSSSGRPAVAGRPGGAISGDPSSALFPLEVRTLRVMVAPIRDREIRFAWITSQTNRPVELKEQFQASRELIAHFKRWLVRSLRQSETWTVTPPPSTSQSAAPTHEERERSLSLRQYRLDACGAALRWATNDEEWLSPHGPAHQPARVIPDVRVSMDQTNEFTNVPDVPGYVAEQLTLLVQIAQWLALARGHAAVHLFCDFCRLFSLSGVDVSDPVQTASCEDFLSMVVWSDQSARSDPMSAGFAAGSADSGMVSAAGHGVHRLGRVLMGVETCFFRVGDVRLRRSVQGVDRRRF